MVRLKETLGGIEITIGRFQFLMVRLKVRLLQSILRQSKISIPYGSIKRITHLVTK